MGIRNNNQELCLSSKKYTICILMNFQRWAKVKINTKLTQIMLG